MKKQGATSILVIIMMVVLIVLGLAILTTTLSGARLALKKQVWLADYYALEGQCAQVLSQVDAILQHEEGLTESNLPKLEDLAAYQPSWSINEAAQRFELSLTVTGATENQGQNKKHITLVLALPFKDHTQIEVISYRQWQDDFTFEALPGFDDPLTQEPVFNLDPEKP